VFRNCSTNWLRKYERKVAFNFSFRPKHPEKGVHKMKNVIEKIKIDAHVLDRANSRGGFADAEDLEGYFQYQALKNPGVTRVLSAFRRATLFCKPWESKKLALLWKGFETPAATPDEDDIVNDAVFFFRGYEGGIRMDTLLFYPVKDGGCRRVSLNHDDIKYIVDYNGNVLPWKEGFIEK